jgi:hypothetical protein
MEDVKKVLNIGKICQKKYRNYIVWVFRRMKKTNTKLEYTRPKKMNILSIHLSMN